jgi:hypothetical protein
LRDHCGDILKWIDAEIAEAGGGGVDLIAGGGITITGGDPATISVDPAGVTLTGDVNGPANANQVNKIHETSGPTALTIGNINSLDLLKRSGSTVIGQNPGALLVSGDVNGTLASTSVVAIHETSGPTQLVMGAVANGELLRRVGATVVGIPTTSIPATIPAYLQHIWLKPPTVANAWDDEFESGSADLATRGWNITSGTTTVARIGDIQPGNMGAVAANQYRSTIVGSTLIVQLWNGGGAVIWKTIPSIVIGEKYYVRIGAAFPFNNGTTGNYVGFCLAFASGGFPDFNNRYLTSESWSSAAASFDIAVGRALAGSYSTAAQQPRVMPDIHGWRCVDASGALHCELGWSDGLRTSTQHGHNGTGTFPARGSISIAFIELTHLSGALNYQPPLFYIDFARKKTGNDWLIST